MIVGKTAIGATWAERLTPSIIPIGARVPIWSKRICASRKMTIGIYVRTSDEIDRIWMQATVFAAGAYARASG